MKKCNNFKIKKMKKRNFMLLCITTVVFLGVAISQKSIVPKYSEALTTNIEAISAGESESTLYKKSTGDCTIEADAGAIVELKLLGVKIASAKAGVTGRVTFKDIRVDCERGGEFLCEPRDCANFYIDIIKETVNSEDGN